MSNVEAKDKELDELKQQIEQAVETEKDKAAQEPSPEPEPERQTEVVETQKDNVTPSPEPEKAKDDPMEWAKKKGFKTPEDMARALLQKEQEFHQSRQKAEAPTPVPAWQPRPDMGNGQGYQQPYPTYQQPPRVNAKDIAAYYPQLAPEDVERVLPLVMDAAQAISARERAAMEQRFGMIERSTQRNNEMMTLMQDPAFRDNRVQKEVHEILDADPSIFQRERTPLVYAYEKAMVSLARKQLQQGLGTEETPKGNRPPATAGGGNGSAFTSPRQPTESEMMKWSAQEMKTYMTSNGKILPKR